MYHFSLYPISIIFNTQNYKSNTIGNPFDWQDETGSNQERGIKSTIKFIEWILDGSLQA